MRTPGEPAEPAPGARRPGEAGPQREARDAELARSGWIRRFTGAPPRLSEMQNLYETLGWEVLLDDLSPEELPEDCAGCSVALALFQVVYTRRPLTGGPEGESSFGSETESGMGPEPAMAPRIEPEIESSSGPEIGGPT